MNARKYPQLTESDVMHTTDLNKHRVESAIARALRYATDPEKKQRLGVLHCVACYYAGASLCGQAFTNWDCRACQKPQPAWANTGVPAVCTDCAKAYKLCVDCGGDLHMRIRRSETLPSPNGPT